MKQTNEMTVQTAQLNDQVAAFLVPNYNDGQKLAIVDEGVLKYLRALLPKASSSDIILKFIDRLRDAMRNPDVDTLEQSVKEAKDYVAFHESINLLKRYFDPNAKITYDEPFNIASKPLTVNEMMEKGHKLADELNALTQQITNHPDWKDFENDINAQSVEYLTPKPMAPQIVANH